MKRTVRKRGDKEYTYLSLVEAVRSDGKNTQRELFRLGEVGELERTGQLDRIVAALSSYTDKHWIASDELEGAGAPSYGAVAAVASYFDRVGLRTHFAALGEGRRHQHLADTVFVMVANRLSDPASKRHTILEWLDTVALPDGVSAPLLDQCYRALDVIAEQKEATEEVLYRHLTDLSNLDLRLALYDLTSTYFETSRGPSEDFSSRAYGYSRDKRDDRPQVVIGLLVTGNGIPIAHYVFPGNTRDSTTLQQVMADYQSALWRRSDRARRRPGPHFRAEPRRRRGSWLRPCARHTTPPRRRRRRRARARRSCRRRRVERGAGLYGNEGLRGEPWRTAIRRGVHRPSERHATTGEAKSSSPGGIRSSSRSPIASGRESSSTRRRSAPQRTASCGTRASARCFAVTIRHGVFSWRFDEEALSYEENLLAGRYVLTTSLSPSEASVTDIVRHYKMLQNVERRFRVMKDFLGLRPVHHRLEERVRAHIALCVIAAVIEAMMGDDLAAAQLKDPDLPEQTMTPRRALAELGKIRRHHLHAGRDIELVDRPDKLQRQILDAFRVEDSTWGRAKLS